VSPQYFVLSTHTQSLDSSSHSGSWRFLAIYQSEVKDIFSQNNNFCLSKTLLSKKHKHFIFKFLKPLTGGNIKLPDWLTISQTV